MIPFFPADEMIYNIDELEPTTGQILKVYPDALTCMGCNTCTRSCPQSIDVLECIADALQGNIRRAASRSLPCIQCRLCNVRCPADLSPCNIALLCRRLYGRHVALPDDFLKARIEEIQTGLFAEELEELMGANIEELRARYEQRELQLEP
jgi:ferredoxin